MAERRTLGAVKHLIVVRHAKSSWTSAGLSDFERPLNERGEQDAPRMGERLAGRVPTPDALVTSSAERALATASAFAQELDLGAEAVLAREDLYLASVDTWLSALRELDDSWQRVVTIGHNPGASQLVESLARAGLPELPTCAVVELELEINSWSELAPGCARLARFDTPKGGLTE